jgi:hypothetical protein
MARKAQKDKQARADLLAKIPPSATRVLVHTAKGEQKYKAISDLSDSDEIQTNKFGDPIVMKGAPGRKTPLEVGPVNQTVAVLLQRKKGSLDTDPVLLKTKQDPDSPDVLHEVIQGLAEEAASLRFERDEAAREGKDTSGLSAKRIQALRAVGDTWLKRMDQMAGKTIDLDSQGFSALWKFMLETLREAMNAAKMRPEQVETVFAKYAAMVGDEWKVEARNRMKNAV